MTAGQDHPIPAPSSGAAQRWARRVLEFVGWRADIAWPSAPKCIIIVYPHTSNWDFVVGYLARLASGLPVQWIGKEELFRWPVAGLFRRMGGIPVHRHHRSGQIRELEAEFNRRSWLWLAIAPEGTRAHTDYWKSGFYRLALLAQVPVGLAFIDYGQRVVKLARYITMTGDEEQDLARIRAAYVGVMGRHPTQAGEIRFQHGPDTSGSSRQDGGER